MESTDTAADVAAICRLKYRYLRTLDTKRWDEFSATLTEDVTGAYGTSLTFDTREGLVGFMRTSPARPGDRAERSVHVVRRGRLHRHLPAHRRRLADQFDRLRTDLRGDGLAG